MIPALSPYISDYLFRCFDVLASDISVIFSLRFLFTPFLKVIVLNDFNLLLSFWLLISFFSLIAKKFRCEWNSTFFIFFRLDWRLPIFRLYTFCALFGFSFKLLTFDALALRYVTFFLTAASSAYWFAGRQYFHEFWVKVVYFKLVVHNQSLSAALLFVFSLHDLCNFGKLLAHRLQKFHEPFLFMRWPPTWCCTAISALAVRLQWRIVDRDADSIFVFNAHERPILWLNHWVALLGERQLLAGFPPQWRRW